MTYCDSLWTRLYHFKPSSWDKKGKTNSYVTIRMWTELPWNVIDDRINDCVALPDLLCAVVHPNDDDWFSCWGHFDCIVLNCHNSWKKGRRLRWQMPIPSPLNATALQSQIEWHTSQPMSHATAYHSACLWSPKAYWPSRSEVAG